MTRLLVAWLALGLAGWCVPQAAAQTKDDVPALIAKLKSPFSSDVQEAVKALEKLGPDGRDAVPALGEALKKARFSDEQVTVARALAKMGPAAKDAVPAMAEVIKKARNEARVEIAKTLGGLGPAAKDAVPVLAEVVKGGFTEERKAVAEALGQIGPAAKDAEPALTELSKSLDDDLRNAAFKALGRIRAKGGRHGVQDGGKFFAANAARAAAADADDVAQKHGIDVLVETFAGPPADQAAKVRNLSGPERAKFFQTWAAERVREAGVNGVYILVCKEPSFLQIEVTPKAQTVIDDTARDRVRDLLLADLREKRYDEGLLLAVAYVRAKCAAAAK